jgi:uncharacterized membrane protein
MSGLIRLRAAIRRRFTAGLLILLPSALAVIVLKVVFGFLDGLLQPVVRASSGVDLPGLGVAALVALILALGFLATLGPARASGRWLELQVLRFPVFGPVYDVGKKITASTSGRAGASGLSRVVIVEYPRSGVWTIGFLTGFTILNGEPHAFVYFPTAPMPNSGWIAMVPVSQVRDTDLQTPEAMQAVLSSGLSNPDKVESWFIPEAKISGGASREASPVPE